MKTLRITTKPSALDSAIDEALSKLKDIDPNSQEYDALMTALIDLYKLKEKHQKQVSPDTKAIVFGNLAGILLIISYERVHIVTTKALGFVMKPR
jgi:hypothetical protein